MISRNDVFVECTLVRQLPDHLPESRVQAVRIIRHALLAVSDQITDWACLHLKRAIDWFAKGYYYQSCMVVGEAMTAGQGSSMPLRANQSPDFEPLSAAQLQLRFENALSQRQSQ